MLTRRLVAIALVAIAWTLPATAPASAAENDANATASTLFINLTTDDAWTAHMALFYAEQVRAMGHPVAIFLNVRGVRLADRTAAQEADALSGKTSREMLLDLIDKGATVYVCRMCTKVAGMNESDWIDGAKAGDAETIRLQMAPTTRTMSY